MLRLDGETHRVNALIRHADRARAGLLFAEDADVPRALLLERGPAVAAA